MTSEFVGLVGAIASFATAIGVGIAAFQLRTTREIARLQFEDGLVAQYRELIRRLPVDALLGLTLSDADIEANLSTFYHYFDLSNEQAFLWLKGRIDKETWPEWQSGIRQNMARPAFRSAWDRVSRSAPESFDELRGLLPELAESPRSSQSRLAANVSARLPAVSKVARKPQTSSPTAGRKES